MKVVIFCSYFPPNTSVGIRRVCSLIDFLNTLNVIVKVVTPKINGIDEAFKHYLNLDNVTIFHSSLFSFSEVNLKNFPSDLVVNKKSSLSNLKFFLRTIMVKLKRKIVNPVFGQLADPYFFKFLGLLLFNNKADLLTDSIVFSTAPSWSSHFFASILKNKYQFKLILDYRDPFHDCHLFTKNFSFIEKKLDSYFCSKADHVISVSPSWREMLLKFTSEVSVIRNGYDKSIARKHYLLKKTSNETLSVNYFGTIQNFNRVPVNLLEAINNTDYQIKLNLYGGCDFEDYIKKLDKKGAVKFFDRISNHLVFALMAKSDINYIQDATDTNSLSVKGVIPTKVFEYIGSCSPILSSISPSGDSAELLEKSGLLIGNLLKSEDIVSLFNLIYSNGIEIYPKLDFISTLNRKNSNKSIYNIMSSIDLKN